MTRLRSVTTAALALGAASLVLAPVVAAQDVSAGELRDLAARAAHDPAAAAELRRVDSVDGRPVDLDAALAGAEDEELDRRLEAIAGAGGDQAAVDPGAARADARDIVSDRRFRGTDVPRPFRRVVAWLGERLGPAGAALDRLAERLPGGRSTVWTLLGALVVLAAALAASRIVRRRAARAFTASSTTTGATMVDPARLEREAAEAERRGDLETALRLLFRAGLVRLHRARAIVLRDSLTTGQIRRRLALPEFDRLAARFDDVVYGGRRPDPGDVEAFRRGWTSVLEEVGTR